MRIKGFFHLLAQSLCRLRLFATPQTAACQVSLSFTISQNLLRLISIESLVSPNCLILCRPLLLSSIFPSTRVCSDEVVLSIKWPKYRNLSFGITSSSFNISQFNSDFVGLIRTPVTLVGAPFQCRVQSYHRRVVLLAILVLKKKVTCKKGFYLYLPQLSVFPPQFTHHGPYFQVTGPDCCLDAFFGRGSIGFLF